MAAQAVKAEIKAWYTRRLLDNMAASNLSYPTISNARALSGRGRVHAFRFSQSQARNCSKVFKYFSVQICWGWGTKNKLDQL